MAEAQSLAFLLAAARQLARDEEPVPALAAAWRAFDLSPGDRAVKAMLAGLLRFHPELAESERSEDLERLLVDPGVDPAELAPAGWRLLLGEQQPLRTRADDPGSIAGWIETSELALRLLRESHVPLLEAEIVLTGLRRWLLLSGRWPEFPATLAALVDQAAHNGGAWPFGEDEKARLEVMPGKAFAAAFIPPPPQLEGGAEFADPVTRSVADQYRRWPYPAWARVTAPPRTTLPALVEAMDGGRPSGLPAAAEVLVAGCGTGQEAALFAQRLPEARITAIDLSDSSIAYAEQRCARAGLDVDFRVADLHRVAELGKPFDFISCSGVLHHLPDPEAGWAALVDRLNPGGVMHVMVYSRVARLGVYAARTRIADLLNRPVDDDLLRAVRKRLIDSAPHLLGWLGDFGTLPGVHDMLLHRHEDPFDVARIARAMGALDLELLAFDLPTPAARARYRREHPEDPEFRDVEAWKTLERKEPSLFAGMHKFWCRKPAA